MHFRDTAMVRNHDFSGICQQVLHFATQTGLGNFNEVSSIISPEFNFITDSIQLRNSNVTGFIVSISYPYGMDTLVDQIRGLLQQCTSKDYNTSCPITYF